MKMHKGAVGDVSQIPSTSEFASSTRNQQPIRVLQVFGTLDRGGAETSIMTYYRAVDRERVQFDFVVHGARRGAFEGEVLALGGKIHRVPRPSVLGLTAHLRAWWELLRAHPEYRIVHGHYFTISGVYLAIAKLHGRRVIAHAHSAYPGVAGILIMILNHWLRYGADLKLACSTVAARSFYGDGAVEKGQVVILKNPIEVDRFAFDPSVRTITRQRLGLTDRFVLGHVGRFNPPKNHVFLLDVLEAAKKLDPRVALLLVGDGSLRRTIERRVAQRGLSDSVVFVGAVQDVPSLLQAMDVFVLPSLFEGFGVVAIEAQASGLPAVLSDAVPAETRVSDLVEVVPLASPASHWASVVMGHSASSSRVSRVDDIRRAGFDGKDNAEYLMSLYAGISGK